MTDIELLSNRLHTLENYFRGVKALAVIACILVAAVLSMGQAGLPGDVLPNGRLRVATQATQNTTVQAEIRSQHFILVDETGKERASLAADAAGSVALVMSDARGRYRASLSITPEGPALIFYDPSGQARTVLGSTSMVSSHINLERAPASSLVLFDRDGKLLYRQP